MMSGVSVFWLAAYLVWLAVGFSILRGLAHSRTQQPAFTMVVGGLCLIVPPIGVIALILLAMKPRLDELKTPASGA